MGKKTAVLITVGLTIFVLGTGAAIAANVNRVQTPPEVITTAMPPVSAPADTAVETLLTRDAQYRERLEAANRVIQQANETIANLQAEQSTLQSQNETLLEREIRYRQEIEKANALLQQQAAASPVVIAAPQVAAQAPAVAPAPAAPAFEDDDREDDRHEDDHHEDEDHEDKHERDDDDD